MKPFHVWNCPRRSLSEVVLMVTRQYPVKTLYWLGRNSVYISSMSYCFGDG